MWTSVLLTPITVIPMLPAPTRMVASHVNAILALLAPEQLAQVSKDPSLISLFTLI